MIENYKYEIGENCYIYFWDDYEPCTIKDRKHEYGINFYMTDIHPNWQNEAFLRKTNNYERK